MRYLKSIVLILVAMAALASCSSRSAAIDRMVEELNSPVFRAKEAQTGLFDDSKAEIKENQLVITFLCRPYINLSTVSKEDLPQLQTSAVDEFRTNADSNPQFREGIEALRDAGMSILMVWQDVNGASITIPVSPAEILPK